MKINWGARIAVLYIGFVVMIVTLVAATFRSKPVLVAQDYYQLETRFQEQLDAERATARLESLPQVQQDGGNVRISFPGSFRGVPLEGTITCYFPANAQADQVIPFTTDSAAVAFRAPAAATGYQIRIDWVGKGVHYYYQIP